MFELGPDKLAIIFGAALLFLGPKELPIVARKIGDLRRQLRTVQNALRSELQTITQLSHVSSTEAPNAEGDVDPTAGESFT